MSKKKPRILGLWRATNAAAAVEFAIVAPFLTMLLLGGVELGRALHHHHIVVKSVRDGSRYLTRVPDPRSAVYQDNAKNLMMRGSLGESNMLLLPYWNDKATEISISVVDFDNSGGTFRGGPTIPIITVSANLPYEASLFPGWLGQIVFTPAHQERYIGE